jgi:hypothetical protein
MCCCGVVWYVVQMNDDLTPRGGPAGASPANGTVIINGRKAPFKSFLRTPQRPAGAVAGAVALPSTGPDAFSPDDVRRHLPPSQAHGSGSGPAGGGSHSNGIGNGVGNGDAGIELHGMSPPNGSGGSGSGGGSGGSGGGDDLRHPTHIPVSCDESRPCAVPTGLADTPGDDDAYEDGPAAPSSHGPGAPDQPERCCYCCGGAAARFFDPRRKPWARELRVMVSLALPCVASYFFSFAVLLVNLLFVGHLGADELAAAALGTVCTRTAAHAHGKHRSQRISMLCVYACSVQMYCNVTGYAIGIGLLSAMDTLCSQAFGAENYSVCCPSAAQTMRIRSDSPASRSPPAVLSPLCACACACACACVSVARGHSGAARRCDIGIAVHSDSSAVADVRADPARCRSVRRYSVLGRTVRTHCAVGAAGQFPV